MGQRFSIHPGAMSRALSRARTVRERRRHESLVVFATSTFFVSKSRRPPSGHRIPRVQAQFISTCSIWPGSAQMMLKSPARFFEYRSSPMTLRSRLISLGQFVQVWLHVCSIWRRANASNLPRQPGSPIGL